MKKIIVILAALLVATSLVACDNGKEQDTSPNIDIPTNAPEETPTEDDTPSVDRNFEEKNDVVYVMTPNGAANLRTDTNFDASSLSGISVKNGVELERIEADANWSKVTYEGENYFIANKIIVEKSVLDGFEPVEKTIKIIVPSINVRYVPARTSDDPIATLVENNEVEVVGFNADLGEEGWYKIKLTVTEDQPYEYGYISAYHDYSEVVTEGSTEAAS
ncbi:MAG: hypothetical protein IJW65_06975 [Clostridia bacterium]|nr:hypothetical protein [Clostridia bacterium]